MDGFQGLTLSATDIDNGHTIRRARIAGQRLTEGEGRRAASNLA